MLRVVMVETLFFGGRERGIQTFVISMTKTLQHRSLRLYVLVIAYSERHIKAESDATIRSSTISSSVSFRSGFSAVFVSHHREV